MKRPEGDGPGVRPTVWFMTTGEPGSRQQARGLAEAISPTPREVQVRVNQLRTLVPHALLGGSLIGVSEASGRLAPPWPDVLISCGRRSALASLAIARRNPAPMITAHIQPPPSPHAFDLVVTLPHDRLRGANVLRLNTALHTMRPETLRAAADAKDARFTGLPRPWIGVLLGGSRRRAPFTRGQAEQLADALEARRHSLGGSILITPSRRSPAEAMAVLRDRFAQHPAAFLWDGRPPNPYLPLLALSDELVVTGDSISMISEALATTATVWVFAVEAGPRHNRFVAHLAGLGLLATLGDPHPPVHRSVGVDAMPIAAEAVRGLMQVKLSTAAA
ncbi:MAG TPA: mitochondrial fission ELM1 family protein [Phenylobacterium sp.]|nr:mitochondrial fission ELM1 family protein [Phenylobacterium sp.]